MSKRDRHNTRRESRGFILLALKKLLEDWSAEDSSAKAKYYISTGIFKLE
jgi:hypothetical protein